MRISGGSRSLGVLVAAKSFLGFNGGRPRLNLSALVSRGTLAVMTKEVKETQSSERRRRRRGRERGAMESDELSSCMHRCSYLTSRGFNNVASDAPLMFALANCARRPSFVDRVYCRGIDTRRSGVPHRRLELGLIHCPWFQPHAITRHERTRSNVQLGEERPDSEPVGGMPAPASLNCTLHSDNEVAIASGMSIMQ